MDAISLEFNIVIGVVIASVVQSIFGVGVLLFGTPILMLHGYEFSDILTTLLPISIAISFSQILVRLPKYIAILYRLWNFQLHDLSNH